MQGLVDRGATVVVADQHPTVKVAAADGDAVVAVVKQRKFEDKFWKKVGELEDALAAAVGLESEDLSLSGLTNKGEAWAMIVDLADPATTELLVARLEKLVDALERALEP